MAAVAVAAGCGHSAGISPPDAGPDGGQDIADAEARISALATAGQIGVWAGDLDGDGMPEIVFAPIDASARVGALALPALPTAASAVVLTHGASGSLVVAASNLRFDFSQVVLLAQLAVALLTDDVATLVSVLKEALVMASCRLIIAVVELLAEAVKQTLIAVPELTALINAVLGIVGFDGNAFAECLPTPQTLTGCLFIGMVAHVDVREHCYQVSDGTVSSACPPPEARSLLCSKDQGPPGCCNRQFIFQVLKSSVRNAAPNPLVPADGPIPDDPSTVILDGPVSTTDLATTVAGLYPAIATQACVLGALFQTRNPITLTLQPGDFCSLNTTQTGHILVGNVRQCLVEDGAGVYSHIEGRGGPTARLAGLNELVGPFMLGGVRDILRDNVASRLRSLSANGQSCDGDEVLGGDVPAPPGTVGVSSGDPHLMTFDRVRFDAQAVGELILAHDKVDGTTVQTRTRPLTSRVAVNAAIAASVGTDVVAFYASGDVWINHQLTTVAPGKTMLPGGGALYRTPGTYVVVWPDNSQLHVSPNGSFVGQVRFYASDARRTHMEGLLGDFDGSSTNDIATRGGTVLSPPFSFADFYHVYLDSWRIVQSESLFDYDAGKTTVDFTDLAFPAEPATTQSLSDADRAAAIAICTAASVPADWFDACVLDVALSGDAAFANELASAPPSDTAIDPAGGTVPLPSPIGGNVPPGSCIATGSMASPRLGFEARAVTLSNGKVLVAGGLDTNTGHVLAGAELYDPATGTFSPAGAMSRPRMRFALVALGNGKVLAAGGVNDAGTLESSADLYDPVRNTWTATGNMAVARTDASAATLPDGKVLIVGGGGTISAVNRSTGVVTLVAALREAEIYDPRAGTFTATAPPAVAGTTMFSVAARPDGSVFAATSSTGEVFTGIGAAGRFTSIGALPTTLSGGGAFAITLPSGDVFAQPALGLADSMAGSTVGGPVRVAAGTNQITALANDTIGGTSAAIRLVTGDVFLVGGQRARAATADTQVYRLASGAWLPPRTTTVVRHGPVLANLPNGAVLVMGGCSTNACGNTVLASAELCNPGALPTIPGLFSTGVDANGVALPSDADDPHYQNLALSKPARVIHPAFSTWIPDTSGYRWVWDTAQGLPANVARSFRLTFSLDGLDPATAAITGQWASDNLGVNIVLNGHDIGMPTTSQFTAFTPFFIPAGTPFFVAGTNTLDFNVVDQGSVAGLLVGPIAGTALPAAPAARRPQIRAARVNVPPRASALVPSPNSR
ncbi:MAG TPA: kelch repeat-containing protein [Kofleriaceae bacterium]|nr:kelch repeat-containing protein [Kofleriaceae bacterium]